MRFVRNVGVVGTKGHSETEETRAKHEDNILVSTSACLVAAEKRRRLVVA